MNFEVRVRWKDQHFETFICSKVSLYPRRLWIEPKIGKAKDIMLNNIEWFTVTMENGGLNENRNAKK